MAVSNEPQRLAGREAAPCRHPAARCQALGVRGRAEPGGTRAGWDGTGGEGHAGHRSVPREDTGPGHGDPRPQERHVAADGWEGERCCWGTRAARCSLLLGAACAASPSLGAEAAAATTRGKKRRRGAGGTQAEPGTGAAAGESPAVRAALGAPARLGQGQAASPGCVSPAPGSFLTPCPGTRNAPSLHPKTGPSRAPLLPTTHHPRRPMQPSELGSGHHAACPKHWGLKQRLYRALRAPRRVITACQHRGSVCSAPKHLSQHLPRDVTASGAPTAPALCSGPCARAAVPTLSPCLQPRPTALLGSAGLRGSTGPGFCQRRPRCTLHAARPPKGPAEPH